MTPKPKTETEVLSPSELTELHSLEKTIRAGLNHIEAIGNALLAIKNKKLYRADFGTFEEYLRVRWNKSRTWGHQICESVEVLENVRRGEQISELPSTERQCRALSSIPKAQQVEVWQAAVESGDTTAKGIEAAAESVIPEKKAAKRGFYADWQKFRDLCKQISGIVDELAGLTVDAQHITPARDAAASACLKLEKLINKL